MQGKALGLIETIGLAAAIEAADTAIKSANVTLLGYELSKGGGMVVIKFEGDVGAVKAAVEAGCAAAQKVSGVWSKQIIPRPHEEVSKLINTKDTVGAILQKTTKLEEPKKDTKEEPKEEAKQESKSPKVEPKTEKKKEEMVVKTSPQKEPEQKVQAQDDNDDVCNLCHDPKCSRKKGDFRNTCIHYHELEEVKT